MLPSSSRALKPFRLHPWKTALTQRAMDRAPAVLKDLIVSVVGTMLFRQRRGPAFRTALRQWHSMRDLSRADLIGIQAQRTHEIVSHASARSRYYAAKYVDVTTNVLHDLPILEKEELRIHIAEIVVDGHHRLRPYFTGGTTGKSLVVFSAPGSDGERFARQEAMWAMHGYKLGRDRMAWFSGRHVVGANDIASDRFWRTNFLMRARYYSLFHMSPRNLPHYVRDLDRFHPTFIMGFPSAIGELARFIEMNGGVGPSDVRTVFTTGETLIESQRELIERVFECPVRNQYASSEGAPFIMECHQGRLHIDVTSGVFEVVGPDERPADSGEVLVTSFYMRETPLIRYRIGDRITLSGEPSCPCGWDTPLVAAIEGRASDFLVVPGRGKIFAAQIGRLGEHVHSVLAFRCAIRGGRLRVEMVADRERFEKEDRSTFLSNICERMGDIAVDLVYVDDLPTLPSGKESVVAAISA